MASGDRVVNRRLYILQMVRGNQNILLDDLIRLTKASRYVVLRDLQILREEGLLDRNLRRKKVVILD